MALFFIKLKEYLIIIVYLLIIVSCNSSRRSQNTYVIFFDVRNKPTIKLQLPNGFVTERLGTSGTSIYYFHYPDSSIVYIDGDQYYGLNYNNIRASGKYYDLFDKYHSNDSLTLEGKDSNNKFWKNLVIKRYSFGYINVPTLEKKNELDDCLRSTIKFIRKK